MTKLKMGQYSYSKTTFINPYKGDSAKTISSDSDDKNEGKKGTPGTSLSYSPSETHSLSGGFRSATFLYLSFH